MQRISIRVPVRCLTVLCDCGNEGLKLVHQLVSCTTSSMPLPGCIGIAEIYFCRGLSVQLPPFVCVRSSVYQFHVLWKGR